MLASAIRELAASQSPTWIAAAFFESTVQIWDLNSQTKINEFSTVFCAGARNLALAPRAGMFITGESISDGEVTCYELPSGRKLWERRFVYPSRLRFHSSGQSILCTDNQRSVVRLDVHTGKTLEVIQGAQLYLEDPSGDTLSVPAKNGENPFHLVGNGRNFKVDKLGFAVLDAQFSPQSLCLSEARGPVRCISRVDGKLQWMFEPGVDSHVLRLHYSSRSEHFYGILTNLNDANSRHLVRFDTTTGVEEQICVLNSWDEVFLNHSDQLVTSAGEIRDLSNGAIAGRLPFPQREYPDN